MAQLICNNKLLDAYLAKNKNQTTRFWKKKHNIKIGDILTATNYRRKVLLKVTSIETKPVSLITVEDALRNGYKTVSHFLEVLKKIYKDLSLTAVIIQFECLEEI